MWEVGGWGGGVDGGSKFGLEVNAVVVWVE